MGNEPFLQGLQMGPFNQNWGRMAKIGFLGQKLRFQAQKKPLLDSNHVMAKAGKSCSKKKVPLSRINISLLGNFGCFFVDKTHFWTEKHFSDKHKTVVSL